MVISMLADFAVHLGDHHRSRFFCPLTALVCPRFIQQREMHLYLRCFTSLDAEISET